MDKVNKQKRISKKWYFLILTLLIYSIVSLFSPGKAKPILYAFFKMTIQILPVLIIIYILMLLTNLYVDNEKLRKEMGDDAGFKSWVISIVAGIISVGPVYAWYPLLKDLRQKGVNDRFLVTFLYNRGIKLQWFPVLLLYFGWVYSITLLVVMAVSSVFQGIVTEKLIKSCCNPSSR